MEKPPQKLLDQVRDIIRLKHYSYKTEKSYVHWIKRYILFHNKRHPKEMAGKEIEEFLTPQSGTRECSCIHSESGIKCHFIFV